MATLDGAFLVALRCHIVGVLTAHVAHLLLFAIIQWLGGVGRGRRPPPRPLAIFEVLILTAVDFMVGSLWSPACLGFESPFSSQQT